MPTCVLGQKPRFDAPPTASSLPQSTDIARPAQLVRSVPFAEVAARPSTFGLAVLLWRRRTIKRRNQRVLKRGEAPPTIAFLHQHSQTHLLVRRQRLPVCIYEAAKLVGNMNKCNVVSNESYLHFQGLQRSIPGSCCKNCRELGLNIGCPVRRLSTDAHKIAVWRIHSSSRLRIVVVKAIGHFDHEALYRCLILS